MFLGDFEGVGTFHPTPDQSYIQKPSAIRVKFKPVRTLLIFVFSGMGQSISGATERGRQMFELIVVVY